MWRALNRTCVAECSGAWRKRGFLPATEGAFSAICVLLQCSIRGHSLTIGLYVELLREFSAQYR